jgi:hypothetical protein
LSPPQDGICIELYYKDNEIKREDKDARRLFLSDEFNSSSGRHLTLDLNTDRNKFKKNQLKIIDQDVFNKDHHNVALSKNKFAEYISEGVDGFNDFDFGEFQQIFMIIEKILKHLSES